MWALARAAGVEDWEFWECTPVELEALLDALGDRERERSRRADLRAGLIAAEISNNNPNRKRGARAKQPEDFFREGRAGGDLPVTDEDWARLEEQGRLGPTTSIRA